MEIVNTKYYTCTARYVCSCKNGSVLKRSNKLQCQFRLAPCVPVTKNWRQFFMNVVIGYAPVITRAWYNVDFYQTKWIINVTTIYAYGTEICASCIISSLKALCRLVKCAQLRPLQCERPHSLTHLLII